jgi:hypothetical protein
LNFKLDGSFGASKNAKLFKYLSEINDLARNKKLPDDNNFDKEDVELVRLGMGRKF